MQLPHPTSSMAWAVLALLCSFHVAVAEDNSSKEVDRIYGIQPRSRMQVPEAATPARGPAMTPQDRQKILDIQNRRLALPNTQALIRLDLVNNPILNVILEQNGPDVLYVLLWNELALDLVSLDHTKASDPTLPQQYFAEQFGPPRSSRALAMVHLAIFEAVNTITNEYKSYKPSGGSSLKEQILAALNKSDAAATPVAAYLVDERNLNPDDASVPAAISYAAYGALSELYPKKQGLIDAVMVKVLASISPNAGSVEARKLGVAIGRSASATVKALRANDGSDKRGANADGVDAGCKATSNSLCLEPRFRFFAPRPAAEAMTYQPDDISRPLLQLGGVWGDVTPFESSNARLVHPKAGAPNAFEIDLGTTKLEPPAEGTPAFTQALTGLKSGSIPNPHVVGGPPEASQYGVWLYGGSGTGEGPSGAQLPSGTSEGSVFATPTLRTDGADDETKQEFQANFWGYDATALLCAPPRLYNMLATSFALSEENPHNDETNSATKMARYLAMVNLALADAGIVSWKAKYAFFRDRPVDYIRYRDPKRIVDVGGSPSKAREWTPLGQVSSNFSASNTTPPFPSYPSGHAVFGGALFQVMRSVYGIGKGTMTPFHFVSDEYNGLNAGSDGRPRPYKNVLFTSLDAAEWENAESRVWLGIHFQYEADHGVLLGNRITENLIGNQLQKIH